MQEKELKKYFAIGFIIILAIFLGYALRKYISAVFGALILFYVFNWLYKVLTKKLKFNKSISAIIVIIISIIVIVLPSYFLVSATVQEIGGVLKENVQLTNIKEMLDFIPQTDLTNLLFDQLSNLGSYLQSLIINSFNNLTHFFISLTITYFVLYYLLINENAVEKKLIDLIPFNVKNSKRLITEFRNVTYSTVITTGLIAIIQGSLLAIGFHIFGLKGAIFWGIVTAFLSILPVVGPPFVWAPAAIILFIQQNYLLGIGMLIWGEFLSNIDNFIRPYLQKKIGRVHPLITILGVFIGLPTFGLLGIIIGPLLLSYFLLSFNMFREEYLDHTEKITVLTDVKKEKKFEFLKKKTTKKKSKKKK
jgi:predicted PurR-regulated permease PerM